MEKTKSKDKIIRIKINQDDNLETKLFLIKKMIKYGRTPISMYKLSIDTGIARSHIYYHFQSLIKEKIIEKSDDGYKLLDCFYNINTHLEELNDFFSSLMKCNPLFKEEDIMTLANYILTISILEIE